jgi:uncharacterized membrane protein YeaQ/YmgE (transglycosylase-associated protein family)
MIPSGGRAGRIGAPYPHFVPNSHFPQVFASVARIQAAKEGDCMGHGLIAWIVIGVLAGWITGKLMKGSGYGFIMDMIVGLIGALIGGFLSSHLGAGGVGQHGIIVSVLIAVVGAVILTWLVRLISGNRGTNL